MYDAAKMKSDLIRLSAQITLENFLEDQYSVMNLYNTFLKEFKTDKPMDGLYTGADQLDDEDKAKVFRFFEEIGEEFSKVVQSRVEEL